jgi:ribosome-binding factor A
VNEQLRRELMELAQREVKDPRVGTFTITAVEAAPDLSFARVFVHRRAQEGEAPELMEGLRAATPFLRGELGRRLRLRRIPDLAWQWDRSFDHAQRIERLLDEVRPSLHEDPGPGEGDGPD